MYTQSRSLFINDYRDIRSNVTNINKNYNRIWGPEYIIYLFHKLKDNDIDGLVDGLMILQALGEP